MRIEAWQCDLRVGDLVLLDLEGDDLLGHVEDDELRVDLELEDVGRELQLEDQLHLLAVVAQRYQHRLAEELPASPAQLFPC